MYAQEVDWPGLLWDDFYEPEIRKGKFYSVGAGEFFQH